MTDDSSSAHINGCPQISWLETPSLVSKFGAATESINAPISFVTLSYILLPSSYLGRRIFANRFMFRILGIFLVSMSFCLLIVPEKMYLVSQKLVQVKRESVMYNTYLQQSMVILLF